MRIKTTQIILAGVAVGLLGAIVPQQVSADTYTYTRTVTERTLTPMITERIIERPAMVERVIERPVTVERVVEKPVFIERVVEKPVMVERFVESPAVVERTVAAPAVIERQTAPMILQRVDDTHLLNLDLFHLLHLGVL